MSSLLVTLTDKERFEIFYELGDVKNTGLHLYGEDGAKHKPNVGEMSDIIVEKSTSTKFHDNPLTTACREKNHPMVTMLTGYLRDHGRVDLVNSTILDGEAALYVASHAGCEQSVSSLIANGAKVNQARTSDSFTPLIAASLEGHVEVVDTLLAHGADINQPSAKGWTPLNAASFKDFLPVVATLLAHGANVNQETTAGHTPLHTAADRGFLTIVAALLAHGADVNQETPDGHTPLYTAADRGHLPVIAALLAHGANIDQPRPNGCTPLYIASERGFLPIVAALLAHGANIEHRITGTATLRAAIHFTPLHTACYHGNDLVADFLITRGADPDALTDSGKTPMALAKERKHAKCVAVLQACLDRFAKI